MLRNNLKKGDLIVVATNSYLNLGIFYGLGSKDNIKYYRIPYNFGIVPPKDIIEYKSYVHSNVYKSTNKYVKVSISNVETQIANWYLQALVELKLKGIIPEDYNP